MRIGIVQSVDSLNPFIGVNDNAYIFYGLVYDYLICLDEDLQPKPNLATSWSIVDDYEPYGSVWQYNLSHNAYWHDGEPVNADDVVFTFEYQIGDKWVTMWAYQPYTLLVDHVEKVDEFTIRLFFAKEGEPVTCSFGDSLMMPIIPEHIWRDIHYVDAAFGYENPFPIGSGPFKCTEQTYDEYLRGDRMILYPHDRYHGGPDYGKEVQFDRLILESYLEPTALLADLQRGAIDLAQFDAPTFSNLLTWLDRNPTDKIHTHASPKCTGFSVELGVCMNPPAASPETNHLRLDPTVRMAMAHSTDKQFIVDYIYRGYADIGSTICSPVYDYWYWEPTGDEIYEYDIDLANQLLDDAGYLWNDAHTIRYAPFGHPWNVEANDKELEFEIIVEQEIIEDRAVAAFLVEEYAKIGIKLVPIYVDPALWGTIVYGGVFDLTLTYWSGDPDPNYILYTQTTEALSGWSENWYSNAEYDENYSASVLETDPEERLVYVENCQRHMYRDNAFIVYAYPYECTAWRTDRFSGWGDWEAHPGRALSNFWTANDLYFDLAPLSSDEAPFVILDNVAGPAGTSLEVTAYAEDPEGVEMEYLLDFGDGANVTGTVPDDGEIAVSHTFSAPGQYNTSLTVSDGNTGTRQGSTATIIGPGGNAPPSNLRIAPSAVKGEPDVEMTFTISGKDYEGDPVSADVEFGEVGSHSASFTGTSTGFTDQATETFTDTGDYPITLTANDTHNETVVTLVLTIAEPEEGDGGLPVALMLGIAAVVVVAVAAVVVIMWRKKGRPKKEDEEEVRLP